MSRASMGVSSRIFNSFRSRRFYEAFFFLLFPALLISCATTSEPLLAPQAPPMTGAAPFVEAPAPVTVAEAKQQLPSGSLWNQSNQSLFQDIKARRIGDILTITVSEESTASKEATTQANRGKSFDGSFNFSGAGAGSQVNAPVGAASFGPYSGSFNSTFTGKGATSRADSMSAYMTVTVVGTLPNGNLVIRGSRWTKVNDEMQQIVLEGVVRPMDVTRNNTVLSQNIAEAKIFLVGKGPVSQHQKPGWLLQLLDLVSPF